MVKVSKKLSNGSIKMGYNSEIEPITIHPGTDGYMRRGAQWNDLYNALRISERAKKFYASHRESIKAKSMAYYRAHREARMAQMREYNKIKI